MALVPLQRPKNSFSPSVEDTVRLQPQNCEKNGLSFKLLACGMYVIAAEQTKAPFDPKGVISLRRCGLVGGNVVLRC